MQNAYKIKISYVRSQTQNYREILVNRYLTYEELHRIIQILFGFQDYHLRRFENKEKKIEISVYDEDDDIHFKEGWIYKSGENTLLANGLLSKDIRKFDYVYDYGIGWGFDVEYLGMEKMEDDQYIKVIDQKGHMLIEDCGPQENLEKFMKIYTDKDKKKLFEEYDYFDTREIFEAFIKPAFGLKTEDKIINQVKNMEKNKLI